MSDGTPLEDEPAAHGCRGVLMRGVLAVDGEANRIGRVAARHEVRCPYGTPRNGHVRPTFGLHGPRRIVDANEVAQGTESVDQHAGDQHSAKHIVTEPVPSPSLLLAINHLLYERVTHAAS